MDLITHAFARRLAAACFFIALAIPVAAAPIVPPGAKPEKLFEGQVLTEGVAVGHDGLVYFSDITFSAVSRRADGSFPAGHIWRFDPATGKTVIYRSPSGQSNGLKFDAAGNMIAALQADFGPRCLARTDMATGETVVIAGLFDGRPLNSPNDITIDDRGRIYFSDPRYVGHESVDQAVEAVYRRDPDGSLHRIITDAGKPNGVCVSPDQKTLYVGSHDTRVLSFDRVLPAKELPGTGRPTARKGTMQLLAYDLAADGSARFRKVLVDYAPQDGPDGIICDTEGNLYVACRDVTRPGIRVYDPEGKEIAEIPTELPTNVGFGRGEDSNLLYVTAGKSLSRIRLNRQGHHPSKPQAAGATRQAAPTFERLVSGEVMKLAGGFTFTEGPARDKYGSICFSDIPNNRIHRWDVAVGKLTTVREQSGGANGLFFDERGNLLACEGTSRRVTSTSPDGKTTVLADSYAGKRLNSPNDLWIHPSGRIYFTDPRYGQEAGPLEQDGFHVYSISPDHGTVTRVISDLVKPNGVVGTADGTTLYVSDPDARKIHAYRIRPDGSLTDHKVFCESGSDGMTLDERGNLYLTAKSVLIYSPAGELIETIEVPEGAANVCFGGPDRQTLFITARTGLYAVPMRVKGQ